MHDFKLIRRGRTFCIGTYSGSYWGGDYRVQFAGGAYTFKMCGFLALQHFADRNNLTIEWL